uniref:HMA domain-containing protein n=1 Tax=Medicago truncatula TaxID=3880 RepID=I3SNR0_MEDTR|nr:unknown [Medicago truncatula]
MAAAKPAADQQVPPGLETLKYQTWVLKVLIHCDGCTKRVKKILQGIEGVYRTEIDSRQHKVTVTGNVDAETLIKKLSRSGKSVELWPEKPPEKKDKKSSKSKGETENIINKEIKEDQKNSTEHIGESSHEGCIDDAGDDGEEDSDHKEGNNGDKNNNKSEGGAKKKKKKKKEEQKWFCFINSK